MDSRHDDLAQRRNQRDNKRKCHICARTFSKVEHLERHIRSHTKEKPFECRQCGRKYGRNDSLLRHTRYQHKTVWSSEPHGSPAIQAIPSPGIEMMDQISSGQRTGITSTQDTDTRMPLPDGLNGMSVTTYHSPHQLNPLQPPSVEAPDWDPTQQIPNSIFPDSQQTNLAFENWLSDGNLDDSLLRNWPFVLDDSDLGGTRVDTAYRSRKPLVDFRQSWYTQLDKEELTISGYTTPLPGHNQEVDDNYRQSLHRKLQIRVLDQSLPSAEFLNLCVRAYFKRFHPVFPVIHAATFRPSKTNAVLLLSICSIGSLLTGHPGAAHRGIQLFERLNKAILSNWETLMRRGPDETFAMIQAALLGQTFGLLSGQAKHLVLVDTFHGTIVAWARRAKIFHQHHQSSELQDSESRWREWARTEEMTRLALAVRIHDAEIASMLHHETILPLTSRIMPIASSDAVFFASNPQDWMALKREAPLHVDTPSSATSPKYATPEVLHERLLSIPVNCHFSIYSAMEDVLSAIMEARVNETLTDDYINKLHFCLVAFRKHYLQSSSTGQMEALQGGIIVLWHFLFISLHADLDLLEKSTGRDGPELDPSDLAKIHKWARSDSSKRSVAHAMMIKKTLENFPLTSEPAVHVPRTMFSSALCLFCYSKYGDGGEGQHLYFPEFQLLDVDLPALLWEASASKYGSDEGLGPVYGFADLLQRIGHWGISRKFASILDVLIHVESSQ